MNALRQRDVSPDGGPHVLVLMAVRNGGKNLREQLDSLAAQEHRRWSLLVSDDGSTDDSREILADFAREGHDVTVLPGPCTGPADNFLSLLRRAGPFLQAESLIALCDQDDVWFPGRLSFGLEQLAPLDPARPAMVFHFTLITDAALRNPRRSAARPRAPGFRNALVQNIASGNTILLNRAGTDLVCAAAMEPEGVVMHDWWIYQIVTGAGGIAIQDPREVLYYRQHGNNEIGANDGWRDKAVRMALLFQGRFRAWNATNVAALEASAHRLTPENRALMGLFRDVREGGLGRRLRALWRARLYRQSVSSTIALWVATVLRRM
ncbi:glycosyltransferase [Paenirhodobacter sp.]|jgi:glycosyltransferase involved in cell wall biosynthesis|uniref:glycosyltransferase n=1 Tax=Paenirhodobacter sp. TaxID=1965326 RepID=UPI003B5140BB